MKASEAMRLGAMVSGQAYGVLEDEGGNTCALGAVRRAAGFPTSNMTWPSFHVSCVELSACFPVLEMPVELLRCPGCGFRVISGARLIELIIHLNNDDRWTRERIADLVQEYEERAAAASRPMESYNCTSAEELVATV